MRTTKNNGDETLEMHHWRHCGMEFGNEDIRNIHEIEEVTRWVGIRRRASRDVSRMDDNQLMGKNGKSNIPGQPSKCW